jgi:hypothetical protein
MVSAENLRSLIHVTSGFLYYLFAEISSFWEWALFEPELDDTSIGFSDPL